MIKEYHRPNWKPEITPPIDWVTDHLRKYSAGKHCTVFENGSCVFWQKSKVFSDADCKEALLTVVQQHPDFKVRRHPDGNLLVTFKGGVGGIMSGEILQQNFSVLKAEALNKGMLDHEMLSSEDGDVVEDGDLIAGLYVRARLYLDAENPVVVKQG